ncbi:MOSC domain-containing protein [Sphingomonas immobilis]|uniref:MOSC domain-containing protein n=1 Tax=Sphingomonas immobilis TaxID=3063997 RepID=UPI003D677765
MAVLALLAGKVRPFARGEGSAIAKTVLAGRVRIGTLGIAGDEQADPIHHGGRDKALHHYPRDHYARWRQALPDQPLLDAAGAFGENISTTGLTESDVCIGDRFRLGTALIEVSQARQPCWKQGERLQSAKVPRTIVREGLSGWYYRVLEEGEGEAGDSLTLIDRPLPDWSARRVFDLLVGGRHDQDPGALPALAAMEPLFPGWRQWAQMLIDRR